MILNKQFLSENSTLFFGEEAELVSLGEMNGEEVQAWVTSLSTLNAMELFADEALKDKPMPILFVSACTVDENGERIFDVDDVEKLSLPIYNKLWEAVARKNVLIGADKGVEEAEKNLEEVDS